MEMPATGMLNEGLFDHPSNTPTKLTWGSVTDGIHIDMDHLKKGEVKSVSAVGVVSYH